LTGNILVLVFCIGSLAFHFAAEGTGLTESPSVVELSETAGQNPDLHDHCEDDLISCIHKVHSNTGIFISLIARVDLFFHLPPILPQLPPPKE
jgi:hypothetical protein